MLPLTVEFLSHLFPTDTHDSLCSLAFLGNMDTYLFIPAVYTNRCFGTLKTCKKKLKVMLAGY